MLRSFRHHKTNCLMLRYAGQLRGGVEDMAGKDVAIAAGDAKPDEFGPVPRDSWTTIVNDDLQVVGVIGMKTTREVWMLPCVTHDWSLPVAPRFRFMREQINRAAAMRDSV